MHEIAVSHHLAALSAGPGRVRQDLRHEVNRLGGQQQHHPKAPPKRDPRFRLSSRGDGAGLTMRPSRRPTVTRNGRASIVAWFPQTPQPDAHHIHYRIRRFWEVMIVTRLGPGRCRAHPSARLSLACSPSHHQVQLQFFPPVPASAPILERLFPATRLLFLAAMHAPRCPSPVPLETGLFFLTSLVPRSSPALGFSSPPEGRQEKRGRGSRQPPLPPDYVDYVDDLMHE